MPLEPTSPCRVPGVFAGQVTLPPAQTLLARLAEDELAALEGLLP